MMSLFDLKFESAALLSGAFGVLGSDFFNMSDTGCRPATAGHTSKPRTVAVQKHTSRGNEQGKL